MTVTLLWGYSVYSKTEESIMSDIKECLKKQKQERIMEGKGYILQELEKVIPGHGAEAFTVIAEPPYGESGGTAFFLKYTPTSDGGRSIFTKTTTGFATKYAKDKTQKFHQSSREGCMNQILMLVRAAYKGGSTSLNLRRA